MTKLVPVEEMYFTDLFELENDAETAYLSGCETPRTREEIAQAYEARREKNTPLAVYMIVDEDIVAGKIECYRLDETTAYVGVVIKPAHRRNGYAKKALDLLCKTECERSAGVRLKAEIYEDNPGSMQFFEAYGFRRTGAVTEEIFRGQPRMLYEYEYRG